jgi:septal ring factor EnvC (AmiA/AmiB activator)
VTLQLYREGHEEANPLNRAITNAEYLRLQKELAFLQINNDMLEESLHKIREEQAQCRLLACDAECQTVDRHKNSLSVVPNKLSRSNS